MIKTGDMLARSTAHIGTKNPSYTADGAGWPVLVLV